MGACIQNWKHADNQVCLLWTFRQEGREFACTDLTTTFATEKERLCVLGGE